MINDTTITISTGASRKDMRWVPRAFQWSELVARLSPERLKRTAETVDEYRAMTVAQRGEAKDVGGFVGGTVRGRRNNANTLDRSLITLDADFATADLWDAWLTRNLAGCVYSTHSHTAAQPRLRLVIPLKIPIPAAQYEPVARRVASWLGMDLFDDTTYQPSRLMYWPSASQDGEYLFHYNDAQILDPADVLGTFADLKDVSSWPRSSRQPEIAVRSDEKLPDPTLKEGWIGAFCRAYDITEAIARFIPEAYTPSDVRNRYTYSGGSTPGGLVLYSDYTDDDWAYSWHDTDPAGGGHPRHSFDLVRIHRFGSLDRQPDAPMPDLASYQAMLDLCQHDERVVLEYLAAQRADFLEPADGPDGKAPPKRLGRSVKSIVTQEFPPIQWAIGNLLPPGLAILASAPKFGKSWMALELALCAGLGVPFLEHPAFSSTPCGVLYLALEDSYRRLNERLTALLKHHGGIPRAPSACDIVTTAPTLGTGLINVLDDHMAAAPNTKLVIIDTLQKVRDGALSSKEGAYATDYREIGKLKTWADKYDICVLLLHHLRKMADDDVMSRISGTNALTGAADTLIVLSRKTRLDPETLMTITGRDVEMGEFKLAFDQGKWRMQGAVPDLNKAKEEREYREDPIVRTLEQLLSAKDEWKGTAKDLSDAVFDLEGADIESSAIGKRINKLSPRLATNNNIFLGRGEGRGRRLYVFRKSDL